MKRSAEYGEKFGYPSLSFSLHYVVISVNQVGTLLGIRSVVEPMKIAGAVQ